MTFFGRILSSVMKGTRGLNRFTAKGVGQLHDDIHAAADAVMSTTGEVSSVIYAEHLLNLIEKSDDEDLTGFFVDLAKRYDIDTEELARHVDNYATLQSADNLETIRSSAEPKWIELFRRPNTTPNGTYRLVELRERVRSLNNPELKTFDFGLLRLFKYWFNPSFLILESISWETPANILEKIIQYEAVHEINSWDDLRARLAPSDRQCFAFFHPLVPNDPLIFVEVALCKGIPKSIQKIIKLDREEVAKEEINTAVFYSISNCHSGLAGISFGNFLIKRVAKSLKQDIPELDHFVTLSPLPGFKKWLGKQHPSTFTRCVNDECGEEELRTVAIQYLTESNRDDGMPNDSVTRFHIGNGAILEDIVLNADVSEKGLSQSFGVMVNYLYDLDVVEENHELFVKNKAVPISKKIKAYQS